MIGKITKGKFVSARKHQDANNIMMIISFDMTLFHIGINSNVFKKKTSTEVMMGQLMTNDKEWPFTDVFNLKRYEESDQPKSSSKRKRSTSDLDIPGVVTRSQSRSQSRSPTRSPPPPPPPPKKKRKKSLRVG